jgi:hypothetical protein
MKDIKTLTAAEILNIPSNRPDKLFTASNIKAEAQQLISKWHQDHCNLPEATAVFAHIRRLQKTANLQIADNTWQGVSSITFTTADDHTYTLHQKKSINFELGKCAISEGFLMYIIDDIHSDLVNNCIEQIQNIKYPKEKFKNEFQKYMPTIFKHYKDTSVGHVLLLRKTRDQVVLSELLQYLPNNRMEPVHVAWLINSLLNTACFLSMNSICHNAITASNILISPEFHSASLSSGWWYARPTGSKLLALPKDVLTTLPTKLIVDKLAKIDYNIRMIKAIGIEALGDASKTGTRLLMDKTIPKPILSWLQQPPSESAITDYTQWNNVLDEVFGKRRFVEMNININELY